MEFKLIMGGFEENDQCRDRSDTRYAYDEHDKAILMYVNYLQPMPPRWGAKPT